MKIYVLIRDNHERKPWNSRGVGFRYLFMPCCYIFRTAKDFLYSFSFSISTPQGMFEEIVNTYRNNPLKRKLTRTMMQKKENSKCPDPVIQSIL